jgi:hypothetical protein
MLGLGTLGMPSADVKKVFDSVSQNDWPPTIFSFGFDGNSAHSPQTHHCKHWRLYRVEADQQMFCQPGEPIKRLRSDLNCVATSTRCIGGPGPELGFVRNLSRRLGEPRIGFHGFGVIKAALSGSSMKHWTPTIPRWTPTHFVFDRLRSLVLAAMESNFTDVSDESAGHNPQYMRAHSHRNGWNPLPSCTILRGIVWMQGEHEQVSAFHDPSLASEALQWSERFQHFVKGLRRAAGSPQLAVVIARTLPHPLWRNSSRSPIIASVDHMSSIAWKVREQQEMAAMNLTQLGIPTTTVDLDDLGASLNQHAFHVRGFEKVGHLDLPALVESGERFAEAMANLLAQ